MAWFFTKAALLTFGGAYAVLPYVYQGAVEHYQWLMPTQMLDGLALGETTPGSLIMVVSFVGFVGGWTKAIFGPEHLLWAGVAAAAVVGAILNLAVFFALHVLWPKGFGAQLEWAAALIGGVAAIALFRFKLGVIPVVLVSGGFGWLLQWLL